MTSRALALVAVVVSTASGAAAQAGGGTHAALLLTLPAGARALGLGEAWGAVADDETALFYNPAQLARVRATSAGGSLQRYIVSTTLASFAAAVPLARGTVALGAQVLDYGNEPEFVTVDGGDATQGTATGGTVSAQDFALTAGYGTWVDSARRLRVGASIKLARQHVANVSGTAVAGDLGAGYTFRSGWDVAAALQHFGSRLTLAAVSAPLPWTWRAAIASPVVVGGRFTFRPMAEARQSSGGDATGVLAAEGTWRSPSSGAALAARAGYAVRGATDDRSPLTLGGGLTLGRIAVDYAYEGFHQLGGATHRFGVRYSRAPGGS